MSRINAWNDASGAPQRIVHHGDITRCSHPPMTIFDLAGVEKGAVPLQPIVPGSPEAKAIREPFERETAGLTEGESFSCPRAAP
jgi:hypothetical protein